LSYHPLYGIIFFFICLFVAYIFGRISLLKNKPDIVINCLHGFFGEDGQIQSILNYLKII